LFHHITKPSAKIATLQLSAYRGGLDVGTPKGATADQVKQIKKVVEYAKEKDIEVIINVIK